MTRLALTAGAIGAWLLAGHLGLLAVLIYMWAAAMASTTNTGKTRSVEERLNALIATYGTFPGNVTIGGTLQVTGTSSLLSSVTAGSLSTSGGVTAGSLNMNGDIQCNGHNIDLLMAQPADYTAPNDGCSGGSWCTNERDFYNNLANGWNGLIGSMINRGLIA